jgi:2-C-methyl-D-erythritol 4-phosphate cytidylyltransferase/2-C-methyl-D-erythritol 2,4-cyclodiphosphate synthase
VGIHALVDAILGALGKGDIGQHFPPSDAKWKGADSAIFLQHACQLMQEAGATLVNADITIISEKPKVSPYREAMQRRLAEIMNVSNTQISVKATTTEKLGFTGREEGIAAQAVVMLRCV